MMQLALFDLDNTLLSCDSDFEWTHYLVSKGILDNAYQARNEAYYCLLYTSRCV